MTAFCTTGGIRGGRIKMEKFHPRSFNMGFSREVFEVTGGFSNMRFGEDIDISFRIIQKGFQTYFLHDVFVYHKRRTTLTNFFKQIKNSGFARIQLYKKHPKSLKIVHLLPLFFIVVNMGLLLLGVLYNTYFLIPLMLYTLVIILESTIKSKSVAVGMLSVLTSYTQILAYAFGFFSACIKYKSIQ